MKYSIDRLDKIKSILKDRQERYYKLSTDIFFDRGSIDIPDGISKEDYKMEVDSKEWKCRQAIEKIETLFNNTVDEFLNEEIEIE